MRELKTDNILGLPRLFGEALVARLLMGEVVGQERVLLKLCDTEVLRGCSIYSGCWGARGRDLDCFRLFFALSQGQALRVLIKYVKFSLLYDASGTASHHSPFFLALFFAVQCFLHCEFVLEKRPWINCITND